MEEIPFGPQFENALNSFNRFAGKTLFNQAKETLQGMLAAGTEIYYRRNMGERYFSPGMRASGLLLWLLVALIAYPVNSGLLSIFIHSVWLCKIYGIIGLIIGCRLVWSFHRCARENQKGIEEIRRRKKPYHTRSRGQALVNKRDEFKAKAITVSGLLITCPFAGLVFAVSAAMTAWLTKKQEEQIYSRYLDRRDAEVEEKYMKPAIIGDCPPELTYLYGPVCEDLDRDTREDMADAFVGGIPTSLARGPISKRNQQSPQQTDRRPQKTGVMPLRAKTDPVLRGKPLSDSEMRDDEPEQAAPTEFHENQTASPAPVNPKNQAKDDKPRRGRASTRRARPNQKGQTLSSVGSAGASKLLKKEPGSGSSKESSKVGSRVFNVVMIAIVAIAVIALGRTVAHKLSFKSPIRSAEINNTETVKTDSESRATFATQVTSAPPSVSPRNDALPPRPTTQAQENESAVVSVPNDTEEDRIAWEMMKDLQRDLESGGSPKDQELKEPPKK